MSQQSVPVCPSRPATSSSLSRLVLLDGCVRCNCCNGDLCQFRCFCLNCCVTQVEYSSALHPDNAGGDTALFDKAGLLRQRAVLAHGTCLTDPELKVLGQRGTALAHSPLSNFFFGDRVLQVRHAMQLGVKVSMWPQLVSIKALLLPKLESWVCRKLKSCCSGTEGMLYKFVHC